MIAAVVLLAFVAVGLLDSVHFRPRLAGDTTAGNANYAVEVMSLFDVIAVPLRNKQEKTYSAPLSAYLFAKETVQMPEGTDSTRVSAIETRRQPPQGSGTRTQRRPCQMRPLSGWPSRCWHGMSCCCA